MRKKIFSIIFAFILSILNIAAQALLDKPEMYIGATAGATASMVRFNPTVIQNIQNPQFGINAGIAWRYIAEKHVGIQAELNFNQKGWKESNSKYARQLNYLELPLMTHIYFGKRMRGFINLGPKIGFLISEKHQSVPPSDNKQYATIDNKFDYGLCGGLGMLLNTKAGVYQLDARANYSLGGIFSNRKTDYFNSSCNLNIALCIGWFWKIK